MSNTYLTIGLVIAIVIAIAGLFTPIMPDGQSLAGSITTGTAFPHGISVGLNNGASSVSPTNFSKIKGGSCALIMSSYTLAASTSVAADCAISGVVSADTVLAWFATSSPSSAGPGWEVRGSSASTTAGFITLSITNGTGASAIIPASIASTTKYWLFGTQ